MMLLEPNYGASYPSPGSFTMFSFAKVCCLYITINKKPKNSLFIETIKIKLYYKQKFNYKGKKNG